MIFTRESIESILMMFTSYTAFIIFGFSQAWNNRIAVLVQLITYGLLIMIFSSIFLITPFHELKAFEGLNAQTMIWYVIVTELLTICGGGQNYHEVRSDMLGGLFTASLQRPKSYYLTKILFFLGANFVRCWIFLVFGIIAGISLTGMFPYSPVQFLFLCISIYLGSLLYSVLYLMIASVEIWGPYSRPVLWISQKLCFLFGGLILPLKIYPEWMQTIAWFSPYPAMLNVSGRIALDPAVMTMLQGVAIQVGWLCVFLAASLYVQYLAYQKLMVHGG